MTPTPAEAAYAEATAPKANPRVEAGIPFVEALARRMAATMPHSIDVSDLAPGEYTFVAGNDDPTGGTEGMGTSEDTKTFVVT